MIQEQRHMLGALYIDYVLETRGHMIVMESRINDIWHHQGQKAIHQHMSRKNHHQTSELQEFHAIDGENPSESMLGWGQHIPKEQAVK